MLLLLSELRTVGPAHGRAMPGLTDDVSQPSVCGPGQVHQLHLGGRGPSTLHLTGCPGYTPNSSVVVHREMFPSSHGQGSGPREVVLRRSHRYLLSLCPPQPSLPAWGCSLLPTCLFSTCQQLFWTDVFSDIGMQKMVTCVVSASHPQFLL